ncbi:protein of unknown function [Aminobacter niigataensis]|nr:protein of unknown function [Aminobacter niigataensis]
MSQGKKLGNKYLIPTGKYLSYGEISLAAVAGGAELPSRHRN